MGQALAQRVRIVLACAEPDATNLGVAEALGVRRPTVAAWRRRFAEHRLEGLVDAPRSGGRGPTGCHAFEHALHGASRWHEPDAGVAHLARLRPAAAPSRDLQALHSRRRLARGAFTGTDDIEAAILAYIAETNAAPNPFIWTRTADDILASVARCSAAP